MQLPELCVQTAKKGKGNRNRKRRGIPAVRAVSLADRSEKCYVWPETKRHERRRSQRSGYEVHYDGRPLVEDFVDRYPKELSGGMKRASCDCPRAYAGYSRK